MDIEVGIHAHEGVEGPGRQPNSLLEKCRTLRLLQSDRQTLTSMLRMHPHLMGAVFEARHCDAIWAFLIGSQKTHHVPDQLAGIHCPQNQASI